LKKRQVLAVVVGNGLEYYDFVTYAQLPESAPIKTYLRPAHATTRVRIAADAER
jgi:hypothetical protein